MRTFKDYSLLFFILSNIVRVVIALFDVNSSWCNIFKSETPIFYFWVINTQHNYHLIFSYNKISSEKVFSSRQRGNQLTDLFEELISHRQFLFFY